MAHPKLIEDPSGMIFEYLDEEEAEFLYEVRKTLICIRVSHILGGGGQVSWLLCRLLGFTKCVGIFSLCNALCTYVAARYIYLIVNIGIVRLLL